MSVMDSRVAELVFDNSQFQKGVKESQETLKKFDKELDKVGENDGLTGISRAASKLSFRSSEAMVDNLASRFSALGIIGMTALQNITNRAVNMGISMAKALTIEPVTTGLQEYELKMDNIRTTMVNTGSDLQTVNAVLNDLNTYSDKTIYKFSDMTNALARLTTNGVKDLGLAKNVIQGMANAAAYAGLTNEKLQSIMYNTSQAYSLGYMSLMDFRSLENAGIGNKFKEVAIETAVELGTLKKNADGAYKSVVEGEKSFDVTVENMRNTLQGKWLTNDVMTKVFEKYADESTELGKAASDAATQITTASKLWDTWKEAAQSGWAQNWELIIGDFEEAKALWTSLNEVVAGENGFLTKFNTKIKDALKAWRKFGGRQQLIASFKNLWAGFTKVVGAAKDAFMDIFPRRAVNSLAHATNEFRKFTKSLIPAEDTVNKLKSVFRGLFSVLKIGLNFFSAIGRIISLMVPGLKDASGGFLDNAASLGELLTAISDYLETNDTFFNGLKKIYDVAKQVFDFLANGAKKAIQSLEETFGIDIHIPTFDELQTTMGNIRNFFKPVTDAFSLFKSLVVGGFTKVKETISGIFGKEGIFGSGGIGIKPILGITAALYALFHIKENFDPFKMLMDIFSKGFDKALDFTGILDDLGDALSGFVANVRVDGLLKISFAIGLLTISLTILAAIDPTKLEQGIASLTGLAAGIVGIGYAMSKLFAESRSWKDLAKGTIAEAFGETAADSMIKLAGALLILSIAMMIFSKIDPEGLGVAIGGMVVSIIALVGAMYALKGVGGGAATGIGVGLMSIAVGVLIISGALKLLSTLSWEELNVGLTGLAASLIGLVVALILLDGVKFTSMAGIAIAALGMGMALVALAVAMKLLSTISAEDMNTAMQGFASGLIMIGLAIAGLSALPVAGVLAAGVALALASVALIGFAAALAMIAAVGEAAAPALETLSGTLLVVVVALAALSFIPAGGLLAAAAAMLLVSVAMVALSASVVILAAGMMMLNGVEIGGIADGFFAMAGPLALVGASLIVVTAGIVALTAALLLFSPALLVLAGAAAALEAFNLIIKGIANSIDKTSNAFDKFVTNVEKLTSIEGTMTGVASAIKTAVDTMKDALKATRGSFKEDGAEIIRSIQEGIDTQPLDLSTKLQTIISAGSEIFGPEILGANLNAAFTAAFGQIDFAAISSQFSASLQGGLATMDVSSAASGIADQIVSGFALALSGTAMIGNVRDAGRQMVNEAISGAKTVDTRSIGVHIGEGLIVGMESMYSRVAAAAARLAEMCNEAIRLAATVNSPSRFTTWVGEMDGLGLANGLKNMTRTVESAARALADTANDSISDVSSSISPVFDMSDVYDSMTEFDDTWRPVIKPTLDMSGVNPGALNANVIASNSAAGYNLNSTSGTQPTATSFAFTQNNYSPKPLSRTEIYRQTKNQFATIEGLVNMR